MADAPAVDLRSDTVTLPSPGMRAAMASAAVGDDVKGEDATVRALEQQVAQHLGKQAGLFAPSGTQSNLLGLFAHCERGDEYIVGDQAHTYQYEGGGAAVLGSIQPQPVAMSRDGTLSLSAIEAVIKPEDFHFAKTRVVCLENTHGGVPLPLDYAPQVRDLCQQHGLSLHLDGARLLNAAVAQGYPAAQLAEPFDSISLCLSKGLGAPVGSVLVGDESFIQRARRWRKVLGGGMRQAGIIAAAGIYALEHHVQRLAEDHRRTAEIAQTLAEKFGGEYVRYATNMVHLSLDTHIYQALCEQLTQRGIVVGRPRWVVHRDIDDEGVAQICQVIRAFSLKSAD